MVKINIYKHNNIEKLLIHSIMKFKSINEFLFDLENFLYKNNEYIDTKQIFITGLARSGTSAALNSFCKSNLYGSLTYDDIPFLLCPNLFNKFKKYFKKKTNINERAHGDGISISQQSPEALEEFFWKKELNNNYIEKEFLVENKILDENIVNFQKYINLILQKYKKKIYISKNNNNILRISYISQKLKDSIILIFFRNPIDHCRSLMEQHLNFQKLQTQNKFVLKYMNYLGHYEFGKNLKRFKIGEYNKKNPENIDFWIEVWINYYKFVLDNLNYKNIHLICYEDLAEKKNEYIKKKINNKYFDQNLDFSEYNNKNKKNIFIENDFKYANQIYEKLRELS